MPSTPALSVVIPHYGDPEPTLTTVRALREQAGAPALQVVVADDASPEPFPETAGVDLVRRAVNGGFGSAVNSGAERAEADLLLILNSDVTMSTTFVTDLLAAAKPWMPAVASPWVVDERCRYQWVGRHFPTVAQQTTEWLTPLARWRHLPRLHEGVGHDTGARAGADTVVDFVVGACMLMPTAEFRAVGGFDERFFMNAEEVDLQRRLRERGVPSVVLGSVLLEHEGGGSSDPLRRRQWLVDGRFRYAAKWGGRRRLAAALAGASVVNFGVNSLRQVRGVDVDARQRLREELGLIRKGLDA